MKAIEYTFNNNQLGISQKQGIITLLPKKDKDTLQLKNWRPISLLNTDYKIITGCISNRLRKVLIRIINDNQTGFLSNRYIGDTLMRLLNTIEYTNEHNIPAVLIAIDFE